MTKESKLQPDGDRTWDPGGSSYIYSVMVASFSIGSSAESRTDLDSHANMPVVGREAYVLADLGKTRDVFPFSPDYKPLKVPMVDAALKYECPFDGKVYILVIRNALYVPSMDYNLIPPFMMREAGLIVKDTPKIQVEEPSEDDHAISFPETGLRIPLSLNGTFSYFPTSKPSVEELVEPEEVYMLTPTTWNPHSDVYARNEEAMLDWEGNMKPKKDREFRIVIDDIPDDGDVEAGALCVSSAETDMIDAMLANQLEIKYDNIPLDEALSQRAWEGDFKMSIGSTVANDTPFLLETVSESSDGESPDDSSEEDEETKEDDSEDWDDWDFDAIESELDDYMAAALSSIEQGVSPDHLAKVWRISYDDAKRTLDNTSQLSVRPIDPILAKNYGTNDRMLRYKRIKEWFFMDTFFATKKGGKS